MTLSKFRLVLAAITFSLSLAACGGGDDDDDVVVTVDARIDAAATVDAASSPDAAPTTNALGQVCSSTIPCPDGNTCTGIQGVGSATSGYCSPVCTQGGPECAAGYTGPAGGQPVCALSTASGAPPTQCAIVCTTPAQCGPGLACTAVPGQTQPVSICVPPA